MKTEVLFEHIAQRIIDELNQARHSIYLALAYLTHSEIIRVVQQKMQQSVAVHIVLADHASNRRFYDNVAPVNQQALSCHYIGDEQVFMRHQFCVIDENVVIHGLYHWGTQADSNHENMVITSGDTALARQFIQQFQSICNKYVSSSHESMNFPLNSIIKRLEILKNYVILEDDDDIKRETTKLHAYQAHEKIRAIIQAVQNYQFARGIQLINEFIHASQQIIVIDEAEIAALKLEIRYLEYQLNAYDNEKAELEQLLSQFQHRHTQELGALILQLLHLQKCCAQHDAAAYAEAEQNERAYQQQFEQAQHKQVFELTKDEQQDLKKMFRKASQICHPDKVNDDMQEAAHHMFIRLKKAYDENDIATVRHILAELESGHFHFVARSETINQKDKLKAIVAQLRQKIQQLQADIVAIKDSEEYQTISQIDDWHAYFAQIKVQLQSEIDFLTAKLAQSSQ